MQRVLRSFFRTLLVLVVLVAAAYGCEDLFLRYRISHNSGAAVLEQVPVYEAGEVKGGKLEFYFNQGESQVCVHGLFPHFGSAPCWYVKRHTMKRLSRNGAAARAFSLCAVPIRKVVPSTGHPRTVARFRGRAGRNRVASRRAGCLADAPGRL